RWLAKIGEWQPNFHLPELIFVAGIVDRALQFNGALYPFGRIAPIAMKSLRDAAFIQVVVNDGVEDTAERIPLQLEITVEIGNSDEELDHLFFPESAVAI